MKIVNQYIFCVYSGYEANWFEVNALLLHELLYIRRKL